MSKCNEMSTSAADVDEFMNLWDKIHTLTLTKTLTIRVRAKQIL